MCVCDKLMAHYYWTTTQHNTTQQAKGEGNKRWISLNSISDMSGPSINETIPVRIYWICGAAAQSNCEQISEMSTGNDKPFGAPPGVRWDLFIYLSICAPPFAFALSVAIRPRSSHAAAISKSNSDRYYYYYSWPIIFH